MTPITATNPRWADASHTFITLTVKFHEIDEAVPFTADPNDVEQSGRDLHGRAVSGEFGVIAAFTG